ncbi:hypothetical protein KY495_01415 [Massilia sp. PAMC28688]|uniref:hypothetical protein n=1 Tax=Massilia sp. PAMC28688 TaxID=2861283 RepID=UPI001C624E18|nr:hypothetical protein [Massilia sp. PAMC28688]QYF93928.1 hypothetical protein KY495_01415 [Massilia sp. PAMC28688]
MLDLVRNAGDRSLELGSILWRCIYSVSFTLLGAIGLVFVPQGLETLRLVSQPGWNFPLFLFSVATWSLAAWYSARLTLGRVFGTDSLLDRSDTAFVNCMRLWLPRLLAVLPGAILTVQFYRIGMPTHGWAFVASTTAIALFVIKRRTWFAAGFGGREPGQRLPLRFEALQPRTLRTVLLALATSFALLFAIWRWPVEVTRFVTAPVLLCFALASWIFFGDLVLTYFFRQAGLPSMAAAPLVLFVVFSQWNDNHAVALTGYDGPVARRAIDTHLDAWLAARVASGQLRPGVRFPVFLVAAEGGGLRAAYWTGMVLAKLQDDSAGRFGRHLFALSGVSGGSLGSAAFAAMVADAGTGALTRSPCGRGAQPYQQCMRALLRQDYLSPVAGFLLYPDALQRFLPLAMPSADRARAMELGWVRGWQRTMDNERFGAPFGTLWQDDATLSVPSLLLNATLVDGGNRVIASDLVIDGSFPDAYDALDPLLDLRRMSLATAIHNSARFSYVSPAGTVSACRVRGQAAPCVPGAERYNWGRVIDGGYFENSGVETVRDLLFAMRPVLARYAEAGYLIDPVVMAISNSPGALAPSARLVPSYPQMDMTFLSELLAPPLGLFNTRMARATFAVTAERRDMAVFEPDDPHRFLWFGMYARNDTPVAWALADATFDGMDRLLAPPVVHQLPFRHVLARLGQAHAGALAVVKAPPPRPAP